MAKVNRHLIFLFCVDGTFELANTNLVILSQITLYKQVSVAPAESLSKALRAPILPAHINTSHRQSAGPLHAARPSSLTHHSLSTCVRLASGLHLSPPGATQPCPLQKATQAEKKSFPRQSALCHAAGPPSKMRTLFRERG